MRGKLDRRLLVLAVASVALLGVGVSPASAAPVVDQTQTVVPTGASVAQFLGGPLPIAVDVGSTFVAGLTGSLTRIDIPVSIYFNTGTAHDAQVRVWTVNQITGGLAFPILATQVIPGATLASLASGGTLSTTFATPAPVTAGTKYAFTVGFVPDASFVNASTLFIDTGTPGVDKTEVGIGGGLFTADPSEGISFTTYVDASAAPPAPPAPPASLATTGFDGQPYLVLVGGLLALGVIALGISSTLRRRAAKR